MTGAPLGLTHTQFVLVMDGAHHVPHSWRDRFLQSVADQLTGIEVTDAAVERAVAYAVQRMGAAA